MNYLIKTINDDRITITEDEYKNILQATTDIVTLKNGITIRKNIISIIMPENMTDKIEDRKEQKTGVLHDGGRVIKKFGTWVCANNPDIRIDPDYYKEVAKDCVATEEEWEKIKAGEMKYEEIAGGRELGESEGFKQLEI